MINLIIYFDFDSVLNYLNDAIDDIFQVRSNNIILKSLTLYVAVQLIAVRLVKSEIMLPTKYQLPIE
jgi:hypothetical protein